VEYPERYVIVPLLFVLILYCEPYTGYDLAVPGVCENVKENSPSFPVTTGAAVRLVGALGATIALVVIL